MSKPKIQDYVGKTVIVKEHNYYKPLFQVKVIGLSDVGILALIEYENGGRVWVKCDEFNKEHDFYDTYTPKPVDIWTYETEAEIKKR